jgi:hypothetical protein
MSNLENKELKELKKLKEKELKEKEIKEKEIKEKLIYFEFRKDYGHAHYIPLNISTQEYNDSIISYFNTNIKQLIEQNNKILQDQQDQEKIINKIFTEESLVELNSNIMAINIFVKQEYKLSYDKAKLLLLTYDSIQRDLSINEETFGKKLYNNIKNKLQPMRYLVDQIRKDKLNSLRQEYSSNFTRKYQEYYSCNDGLDNITDFIVLNDKINILKSKLVKIESKNDYLASKNIDDLNESYRQLNNIYVRNQEAIKMLNLILRQRDKIIVELIDVLEHSKKDSAWLFNTKNIKEKFTISFKLSIDLNYIEINKIKKLYEYLTKDIFLNNTKLPDVLIRLILNYL